MNGSEREREGVIGGSLRPKEKASSSEGVNVGVVGAVVEVDLRGKGVAFNAAAVAEKNSYCCRALFSGDARRDGGEVGFWGSEEESLAEE